ncbi:stage II sporulation protein M [Desulfitispora alkaliphila]|uniref:stage II sporulation protein M n=1 Tax=Desulfitispora alkaliphila TaxID=622674 RepID=UPI003D22FB45
MAFKMGRTISGYLRDKMLLYILAIFFIMLGIIAGAVSVSPLISGRQHELISYIDSFLNTIVYDDINTFAIALTTVFNNLRLVFIIWLLGMTVIGIPVIILILFVRGFMLGFTVGFLTLEKSMQGVLISVFSIAPPNFILLPGLIVASVTGISFSLLLVKGGFRDKSKSILSHFFSYSIVMIGIAIVAVIAGIVEAYWSPAMMKLISVYVN